MVSSRGCNFYYNEDYANYIVQFRGNFKEEIDRTSYACGDIITQTFASISIMPENLFKLIKDVPSIILIVPRTMYVLEQLPPSESPSDVDDITAIKINPYLRLSGKGVLIGLIDSGIDYLNEEFINENGTSRILEIWDQSIINDTPSPMYIGKTYSNELINNSIKAFKDGINPYDIVPSKDEIGHGTKVASIIGSKGYRNEIQGVAPDCEFVVVKLLESLYNKKTLINNGVPYVPTYDISQIISGLRYLKDYSINSKKPMVIFIGIGNTEESHSGNSLIGKYITYIAENRGIVLVGGTGNQGDSEGHVSGILNNKDTIKTIELSISKEIKLFQVSIWMQKPAIISVNILSPSGEMTNYIKARPGQNKNYKFIYTDTSLSIMYFLPDAISGEENILIIFNNIKPGIWRFQLRLETITGGTFNIWLAPKETLPENTKFLEPTPFTTLSVPATARKVVTVAYFNSIDKSSVPASGKGFNSNNLINPDITTGGINILTTTTGNKISTFSGSSAATAIAAGVCALLLQWGIIDGNDLTMYSIKVRSYLIYGADRSIGLPYPNRDTGFGYLNILGTLNILSGAFRSSLENDFIEYYFNNLFVRLPRETGGIDNGYTF